MKNTTDTLDPLPSSMEERAAWIAEAGGLNAAIDVGRVGEPVTLPLAEALVLGLMRQGVTKYLAIFGHGSTAIGEVLRVYENAGLVRCRQFRNEMGFSVSALLAGALAERRRYGVAFTGDGSFTMNPQVLIDGVEHGVRGAIVVFDNRRMGAISQLQLAQYGAEFRTSDSVPVDYVQMAASVAGVKALSGGFDRASLTAALEEAFPYDGLSLVHVPVYFGDDPRGGMGAYGRWNVGNWCDDVQERYVRTLI